MPPVRKDLSKPSPCPSLPTPYKSISSTDVEMAVPSPPTTVSDSYQAGFSSHSDTDSDASANSMDVEFSSLSDSSSSSDNECPAQYEASLNERFFCFFVSICTLFVCISYTLVYGQIVLPCMLLRPFCVYASVSQLPSKALLLASYLASTSLSPLW